LLLETKQEAATMTDVLGYAPIAATVFAVPQFLPQARKLWATRDAAGVSWLWATFTTVNHAAWFAYFLVARLRTALVASASVTLFAGVIAGLLTFRGQAKRQSVALAAAWTAALIAGYVSAGGPGLGTLLTASFALQVAPSIWTAYQTARPTGVSAGTWLLIFAELACWMVYGLHERDPRLIALGVTGVTASTLMLARVWYWSHRGGPASAQWGGRPAGEGPGRAGAGLTRCRVSRRRAAPG
jgi:uncharacterized protein with PQ loop repeat